MKKFVDHVEDEAKEVRQKTKRRSFRLITTVLSIAMILWLTMVVYEKFGIGDSSVWINDVLTLMLIILLLLLGAAVVVALMMLIRKLRG